MSNRDADQAEPSNNSPGWLPSPEMTLPLMRDGSAFFGRHVADIQDAGIAEPSLLPGWSRSELVAHVMLNAAALSNLLFWAKTGVETPMYANPEQRQLDISAWSTRPVAELRAALLSEERRLADAADALSPAAWAATVRSAKGRAISAAEVPWMRCRELWVHAVDLGAGASFHDLPEQFIDVLLDDVSASMSSRSDCPAVQLVPSDRPRVWRIGSGQPVHVRGQAAELAGWLIGRMPAAQVSADGRPPQMPAWL